MHTGSQTSTRFIAPQPVQGRQGPVRTCVGCRRCDEASNLRRFVVGEGGRLRAQPGSRRLTGRGAYVHPVEKCLIAAVSRGGFERSFRRKLHIPEATTLLSQMVGPSVVEADLGSVRAGAASNDEDQE